MPTSFLSADAGFPRLTPDIPAEERLNRIQNYLYMLLEQLRYTLSNLGEENFNDAALAEIGEAIQGPVLSVVSDLEGNVSVISQTADAITTRLDNFNGSSSTIEQTASSLTTRLNDFNGSGSTIEQTVGSINTAVFDPNGELSLVSQKADRIDWIVASGMSAATMTLTSDMLQLIAGEVQVYGAVTFTDLENSGSQAFINGNNILMKSDQTGASGSFLSLLNENDHAFGQLWTLPTSAADPNAYKNTVMLTLQAEGTVDGVDCGLMLESLANIVAECGGVLNLSAGNQVVIDAGSNPTLISAYGATYSPNTWPLWCYVFCNDGIYYGGQKILST